MRTIAEDDDRQTEDNNRRCIHCDKEYKAGVKDQLAISKVFCSFRCAQQSCEESEGHDTVKWNELTDWWDTSVRVAWGIRTLMKNAPGPEDQATQPSHCRLCNRKTNDPIKHCKYGWLCQGDRFQKDAEAVLLAYTGGASQAIMSNGKCRAICIACGHIAQIVDRDDKNLTTFCCSTTCGKAHAKAVRVLTGKGPPFNFEKILATDAHLNCRMALGLEGDELDASGAAVRNLLEAFIQANYVQDEKSEGWEEQDFEDFTDFPYRKYKELWLATQAEGQGPEATERIKDFLREPKEEQWQLFTTQLEREHGPIPGTQQQQTRHKGDGHPGKADGKGQNGQWNAGKPSRTQGNKGGKDHAQQHDHQPLSKGQQKGKTTSTNRGERMDAETAQQYTGQGDAEALWQHHDYLLAGEEGAEHLFRAIFPPHLSTPLSDRARHALTEADAKDQGTTVQEAMTNERENLFGSSMQDCEEQERLSIEARTQRIEDALLGAYGIKLTVTPYSREHEDILVGSYDDRVHGPDDPKRNISADPEGNRLKAITATFSGMDVVGIGLQHKSHDQLDRTWWEHHEQQSTSDRKWIAEAAGANYATYYKPVGIRDIASITAMAHDTKTAKRLADLIEEVIRLLTCPSNQRGWLMKGDCETKMVLQWKSLQNRSSEESKIRIFMEATRVITVLLQLATFGKMNSVQPPLNDQARAPAGRKGTHYTDLLHTIEGRGTDTANAVFPLHVSNIHIGAATGTKEEMEWRTFPKAIVRIILNPILNKEALKARDTERKAFMDRMAVEKKKGVTLPAKEDENKDWGRIREDGGMITLLGSTTSH